MIKIMENVPLAELTTFRIGGPAKYLVEVSNAQELAESLDHAKKNNLESCIIGGGSNIVVSDGGFDGLVIMMKSAECKIEEGVVICGAGFPLAELVRFAAKNGLTGMEWAVGIPGTVGGAVRGNAGAYGGDMARSVILVEVFDKSKSEVVNYEKTQCDFDYRTSIFKKDPNLIILSVMLVLEIDDIEKIEDRMKKITNTRVGKVVRGLSAGSFFMNPVVLDEKVRNEFKLDTGAESQSETLPAGWIIEHAGLRGKTIGGAMVSEQHGNFIINTGSATAEDIVMLASIIKQRVRDKYHIQLREEVSYIGF